MQLKQRSYAGSNTFVTKDSALVAGVGGLATTENVYVLVDGYTASASEILTSALMCNNTHARSIGTTTYGKGCGQVLAQTVDSGLVKITSMLMTPVCGQSYNQAGIEPNRAIQPGEDALSVALSIIRGNGLAKSMARPVPSIAAPHRAPTWEPRGYVLRPIR